MKDKILIFTDGASRGNPGRGGWGAVIIEGTNIEELGGADKKTTNNRMELIAALEAIKKTPKQSKIKLYTDSSYLLNGITKWIHGWNKNNWQTKEKKEVLNKDIWQPLYEEVSNREIEWFKIRGHAGVLGNNRADEIATAQADGEEMRLYKGSRQNYNLNISEPTKEELEVSSDNERKNAKAYSYLSLVDGVLKKHSTWADCKERVDGQKDAKFRKAISAEDELDIIKSWGLR